MKAYVMGAGGHATVVIECAQSLGLEIDGVYDDNPILLGGNLLLLPILGSITSFDPRGKAILLGIGANDVRAALMTKFRESNTRLPVLIHPRAFVSPSAEIDDGTVILAGAIVNARAKIGAGCIINSGAIVEHDCLIDDGAHIAPGAALAGNVQVGKAVFIGMRAAVIECVKIGDNARIAAGAVVIRHVDAGARMAGVPARLMSPNEGLG